MTFGLSDRLPMDLIIGVGLAVRLTTRNGWMDGGVVSRADRPIAAGDQASVSRWRALARLIRALTKKLAKLQETYGWLKKENAALQTKLRMRQLRLQEEVLDADVSTVRAIGQIEVMRGTKICRKCFKQKIHEEFHQNEGQSDGLNKHCKSCIHENYVRIKERHIEYVYRWNKKNPAAFREIQNRYRDKLKRAKA